LPAGPRVDVLILRLFDGDRMGVDPGLIFELRLGVRHNRFAADFRRFCELAIASRSSRSFSGTATIVRTNGYSGSGKRPKPAGVRLEMTSWLKEMSHHDDKIIFLAAVAIGMYSATGGRKPLSRPPHHHEAAAHLSL
jgi:hypothetical protein